MAVRSLSWIVSTALHGSLIVFFIAPWTGGSAFEAGKGNDDFVIEHGIAIEGFGLGADLATTEAVEENPMQMSEARPEIEEVETEELVEEIPPEEPQEALPEDTEVITSKASNAPPLEVEPERVEKPEEELPRPAQTAALEQFQQTAVKEQVSSGSEQLGGDTTIRTAYLGKLRAHLERKKVNPRSRLTGTVVIRFTVGPDGEIISREIAASSGSKVLDEAAVASIDRAAPFPSMPAEVADEPMVVSVPFKYSVR